MTDWLTDWLIMTDWSWTGGSPLPLTPKTVPCSRSPGVVLVVFTRRSGKFSFLFFDSTGDLSPVRELLGGFKDACLEGVSSQENDHTDQGHVNVFIGGGTVYVWGIRVVSVIFLYWSTSLVGGGTKIPFSKKNVPLHIKTSRRTCPY